MCYLALQCGYFVHAGSGLRTFLFVSPVGGIRRVSQWQYSMFLPSEFRLRARGMLNTWNNSYRWFGRLGNMMLTITLSLPWSSQRQTCSNHRASFRRGSSRKKLRDTIIPRAVSHATIVEHPLPFNAKSWGSSIRKADYSPCVKLRFTQQNDRLRKHPDVPINLLTFWYGILVHLW